MEEIKLNQERLNKVCYILGSYDYDSLYINSNDAHVWLMVGNGDNYIPKFALDEISEFMGVNWGVCRIGRDLGILFERESPDEVLTIPEGLGAYDE